MAQVGRMPDLVQLFIQALEPGSKLTNVHGVKYEVASYAAFLQCRLVSRLWRHVADLRCKVAWWYILQQHGKTTAGPRVHVNIAYTYDQYNRLGRCLMGDRCPHANHFVSTRVPIVKKDIAIYDQALHAAAQKYEARFTERAKLEHSAVKRLHTELAITIADANEATDKATDTNERRQRFLSAKK